MYVVAAFVETEYPPAANVVVGHRPIRFETMPVNTMDPGAGVGDGEEPPEPVTVTVVVHDAMLLMASVAMHVTSVEPTGNCEPDVGVQLADSGR